MGHNPWGYWTEFSNLEYELRRFIDKYELDRMPTQEELHQAGRLDLLGAVARQGGSHAVAKRLHLEVARSSAKGKPDGYWTNFANLEYELRTFIAERCLGERMPTRKELHNAGRTDLLQQIDRHGAYTVAKYLNLDAPEPNKPRGYWQDFSNLERELRAFIAQHGQAGVMPRSEDLLAAERKGGLVGAIYRHGGIYEVAKRLQLEVAVSTKRKPDGYWDDFTNLERELRTFIAEHGQGGQMPTQRQLMKASRFDLLGAIQLHGGIVVVRERLGFQPVKKPRGYWQDFSNLERELRAFLAEQSLGDCLPGQKVFLAHGRSSLFNAMMCWHGGAAAVAKRLGLRRTRETPDKEA